MTIPDNPTKTTPGIGAALIFRGKALALQARRAVHESQEPNVRHHVVARSLIDQRVIAESTTPMWTPHEPAESPLIAGKVHNLRLAIRRLNGVEVPATAVFSFWKQLGRTNRLKGYVAGRELREGCLIPSIGGGLCQLSNALYDTALQAGFEIVERHAHTQVVPGSLAETGRDATVFWNYVDLRFRSTHGFRIEAELTPDSLIVRFRGEPPCSHNSVPPLCPLCEPALKTLQHKDAEDTKFSSRRATQITSEIEDCLTCGKEECFRQAKAPTRARQFGRTAYLLDEYWPEFDRYISAGKRETDLLYIPLDGRRFRQPNYAWTTAGFSGVKQSWLLTLARSRQSRKLAAQGQARQTALLNAHKQMADRYVSLLPYDVAHVTLTQTLLPFVWRSGDLGGRTFDVLMTGLPLAVLHDRLDAAFSLHPESRTLRDFRADSSLVEAENEALRKARKIITPHSEVAALYPEKALLLDWAIPAMVTRNKRTDAAGDARLVFPATTVGRKGAYELREAIRGLEVRLAIMGPILESDDFWDGFRVDRIDRIDRLAAGEDWLESASAVVLPAFVEHRPRRLLEAVARGVPVIASPACGLATVTGVITVPAGDVHALRAEIEKVMTGCLPPACLVV